MTTEKQAVYFIGWDYVTPGSVPLKALLLHDASPWHVKAIVHDQVWVHAVDDIPLITTDDFLALARDSTGLHVVIQVREALHRQVWLRRARDLSLHVVDEGEAFMAAALTLKAGAAAFDLELMRLPDAFDAESAEALAGWQGSLPDASSNAVLRAYVQFLQTGLLAPLRSVTVRHGANPVLCREDVSLVEDLQALGGGLAWELAPQRSAFLEQVLLVGGRSRWRYAFSGPEAACAAQQAGLLGMLMQPLGVRLAVSVHGGGGLAAQTALNGYAVPDPAGRPCLAQIALPDPVPLVRDLAQSGSSVRLRVRVGETPGQLLGLLQAFPQAVVRLQCDRPGPRGLCAHLAFSP